MRSGGIIGLDIVRFLAALMVTFFHLIYWINHPGSTAFRVSGGGFQFDGIASYAWFWWIGVEVFFVLSGFVIAYSAQGKSAGAFATGRVLRLVPGAFVCATISLLCWIFFTNEPFARLLPLWISSVAISPIGPWLDGVYWTLGVEVSFYVFCYVLIWLGSINSLPKAMIVIGMASVAYDSVHLWMFAKNGGGGFLGDRIAQLFMLRHGCEFSLGVLLWELYLGHSMGRKLLLWIPFMIAGGSVEIVCETWSKSPSRLHLWFIPVIAWLASLVLIVAAVRCRGVRINAQVSKLIKQLGLMTYPLYLIHTLVGAAAMKYCRSIGLSDVYSSVTGISVAICVSPIVSLKLEPALRNLLSKALARYKPRGVSVQNSC